MTALEELVELAEAPYNRTIKDWKEKGGKVVGFICSYIPSALDSTEDLGCLFTSIRYLAFTYSGGDKFDNTPGVHSGKAHSSLHCSGSGFMAAFTCDNQFMSHDLAVSYYHRFGG